MQMFRPNWKLEGLEELGKLNRKGHYGLGGEGCGWPHDKINVLGTKVGCYNSISFVLHIPALCMR